MELLHGLQVRVKEYDGWFNIQVLEEIYAFEIFGWTLLPASSKWVGIDTNGHPYAGGVTNYPMQSFKSLEGATAKIRALQKGIVYHTLEKKEE